MWRSLSLTGFSYFYFGQKGDCELATDRSMIDLFRIGIKNTKVFILHRLMGLSQHFSLK